MFKSIFFWFLLTSIFSLALGSAALAAPLKILNVELACDPAKPPEAGGCGLDDFIVLIEGIIKFLTTVVVIPVATLMVIWAAYVIITAGGSTEKVEKGKKIITVAVIGVAIGLLAGALVGIIYEIFTGQQLPRPSS